MAKAGRGSDQFVVRLPDGMRERIRLHADANGRSMNSELVSLIEMALWEADMSRMQSGMEPLRDTTDRDWEIINLARHSEARQSHSEPVLADDPFDFGDERPPLDEEDVSVGILTLPEGVTDADLHNALVRANRKAFAMALKDLGIVRKPFPDSETEDGEK